MSSKHKRNNMYMYSMRQRNTKNMNVTKLCESMKYYGYIDEKITKMSQYIIFRSKIPSDIMNIDLKKAEEEISNIKGEFGRNYFIVDLQHSDTDSYGGVSYQDRYGHGNHSITHFLFDSIKSWKWFSSFGIIDDDTQKVNMISQCIDLLKLFMKYGIIQPNDELHEMSSAKTVTDAIHETLFQCDILYGDNEFTDVGLTFIIDKLFDLMMSLINDPKTEYYSLMDVKVFNGSRQPNPPEMTIVNSNVRSSNIFDLEANNYRKYIPLEYIPNNTKLIQRFIINGVLPFQVKTMQKREIPVQIVNVKQNNLEYKYLDPKDWQQNTLNIVFGNDSYDLNHRLTCVKPYMFIYYINDVKKNIYKVFNEMTDLTDDIMNIVTSMLFVDLTLYFDKSFTNNINNKCYIFLSMIGVISMDKFYNDNIFNPFYNYNFAKHLLSEFENETITVFSCNVNERKIDQERYGCIDFNYLTKLMKLYKELPFKFCKKLLVKMIENFGKLRINDFKIIIQYMLDTNKYNIYDNLISNKPNTSVIALLLKEYASECYYCSDDNVSLIRTILHDFKYDIFRPGIIDSILLTSQTIIINSILIKSVNKNKDIIKLRIFYDELNKWFNDVYNNSIWNDHYNERRDLTYTKRKIFDIIGAIGVYLGKHIMVNNKSIHDYSKLDYYKYFKVTELIEQTYVLRYDYADAKINIHPGYTELISDFKKLAYKMKNYARKMKKLDDNASDNSDNNSSDLSIPNLFS